MSEITMSQVTELEDQKLRKVVNRVVREVELAIEKVAANHKQPSKYPVSADASSVERILADRFKTFKPEKQEAASLKALQRIAAPAALRVQRYGDLANVNLASSVAVDAQAKALPFPNELKFPMTHLQSISVLHGTHVESPGLIPHLTTDKLELRVHKVTCVDETGGFPFGEAGDDEIDLGATTVDESGDTKKIAPFTVGNSFDDGESKTYSPPKRFATFDLTEGTAFPKSYFVTLVMAEVDNGGLPEFVDKLWKAVKDRVITALAAAVGGAIGVSGGPIGVIIGVAVGYAVGKIFELFKSIWEDDVFPPKTVTVRIPSLAHRWPGGQADSPQDTVEFRGHDGKYKLVYDWRMYA